MAVDIGFEKNAAHKTYRKTGKSGRRNYEHTLQRGRLPYGIACRGFCEKSSALHGARRNPAMCHHGSSSQETGCLWQKDAVMQDLLSKIMFYLNKRAAGKMQIEVILYSYEFGELAKSAGAIEFLAELM